jgi:hypothetical protein
MCFWTFIVGNGIGVMLRDRCREEEDVRNHYEDVCALDDVLNLQAAS